ncbi:unnamed protein product [Caenorhabditis brenneri]
MKHWRFFPILVKIEVLKNMDLSDRLSFSKCSKKCWNLLSRVPAHLKTLKFPIHNSYFWLITCRKSTIQNLIVNILSPLDKYLADRFFETFFSEKRTFIKVTQLTMNITPEYSEMYKKLIDFCDPSFIESIEIEGLNSQEIYKDILNTPQWKNSQEVSLNFESKGSLKVNFDDFPRSVCLGVEEFSAEDGCKIMQKLRNGSEDDGCFWIKSQKPISVDWIGEKIEADLGGEWNNKGYSNACRCVMHPENPHRVLEYMGRTKEFRVAVLPLLEFNKQRDWLRSKNPY